MMTTPLKFFGIAGWKDSGKTTLVAGLLSRLCERGICVSTIKHAHHDFDLDQAGTDSFKHRTAGAKEVMLVSARRWAIQHELGERVEPSFAEISTKLSACDLVLVEGYKREPIPRLEVIGERGLDKPLWRTDQHIRAIACDVPVPDCTLPRFHRSQHTDIADFILKFHGFSQ